MDSDLREYIEWTNIWQEGCDKRDLPRLLLLGDSIVSANRDTVGEKLAGKFYVDKISTSRSFDQKFYWDQLDLYLGDPLIKYDKIYFNFGLHGFHIPTEVYGQLLDRLVKRLKEEKAELCFMLSTPMVNPENDDTIGKQIELVKERNRTAEKVMKDNGIEVLDLYSAVVGKEGIRVADPYHYNQNGIEILSSVIAERVLNKK